MVNIIAPTRTKPPRADGAESTPAPLATEWGSRAANARSSENPSGSDATVTRNVRLPDANRPMVPNAQAPLMADATPNIAPPSSPASPKSYTTPFGAEG